MSRATLLACLLGFGCADGKLVTEIVAVVEGDLAVPEDLDAIELRVDGVVDPITARADLTERGLPRRVAIVHGGGPLGPITIMVEGFAGGESVVTRSARVFFQKHHRIEVVLRLEKACQGVVCERGETCDNGACVALDPQGATDSGAPVEPGDGDDGGVEPPGPDAMGPDAASDAAPPSDAAADAAADAAVDAMTLSALGEPCGGTGECEAGLRCGPTDLCQAGEEGDPCDNSGDCGDPARICGPASACQQGAVGEPCENMGHCGPGISCVDDLCAEAG